MDVEHSRSEVWSQLSVFIITLNEESNLKRCLASIPIACEIVVLDSDSTDQTVAIAAARRALIHNRAFDNYAQQKNAAASYATRPWLLSLDADEELTPALLAAIAQRISGDTQGKQKKLYQLQRRLIFLGRELRFGKSSDWPIRLYTKGSGHFSGSVHEELVAQDAAVIEKIYGCYLKHYSYRNLTDYFNRFNRYTTQIAEKHASEGRAPRFLLHILRPWFEFVSRYFLRLGFLDGYPGYTYALISSVYTFIKYAKLIELKRIQGTHESSAPSLASALKPLE